LKDKDDLQGAIRSFRTTVELDSDLAEAHGALGQALMNRGLFDQARKAIQTALRILPRGHPLQLVLSQKLGDCEVLLRLEARLPPFLKGEAKPADASELLGLAFFCQKYKRLYAGAARFYIDAFAADPRRADDLRTKDRYDAARSAALAGGGQGEDAAK